MNKTLFVFLAAVLLPWFSMANSQERACTTVKYPAPSGSQNDIVFSFDKPYLCGQYANGDWWVSADTSEVVVINSVVPVTHVGYSGLEVNPSTKHKQGFDKRIGGYDASLNAVLPLRVNGDASLVKAVSIGADQVKCSPCLKYAAVLTVTRSAVVNSEKSLRPGYFGLEKVSYLLPNDIVSRLPKFPSACCSEAKYRDFERIARRYQWVQLDHLEGWGGRNMHPIDNMPDYGASIAVDNAISVMRFLLNDFEVERKLHRAALVNYLQMGVDFQAMAMAGMKWPGAGGHGNGRKLPILFAGHVLGQAVFNTALARATFSEDEQVYFSKKAGKALFGAPCTDNDYWMTTRFGRGARDCRDPYGYIDGGGHEIGDAYQYCCTAMPWKYTALAVRMLGLEKAWGHDAFLDYVDRWVSEGAVADPDPCAPYNNVADDYMKVYGAGKSQECIRGDGRYKVKHGSNKDGGHYRNALGDQMWRRYRNYRPEGQ